MGKPENIPLEKRIWNSAVEAGVLAKDDRVIVAVSGGLDSVVLLHVLRQFPLHLEVAHVNFRLRGEESERDARFVAQLCRDAGLFFHLHEVEPGHFIGKSIQTEARRLRYAWFKELAQSGKKVALAHHADDQAETLLLQLFRGTGLKGLGGMQQKRDVFIRPLLPIRRSELVAYAKEKGLFWQEDSSNQSTKYQRNFLRLTTIPSLETKFPQLIPNLQNTASLVQTYWDTLEWLAQELNEKFRKPTFEEDAIAYSFSEIRKHPQGLFFISFWLHKAGFHADQIAEIQQHDFSTETKSWRSDHGILAERKSDELWIWKQQNPPFPEVIISEPGVYPLPGGGMFSLELWPNRPLGVDLKQQDTNQAFLSHLTFPLLLKQADHCSYTFHPFGLKGKSKKLAVVLTEARLTREQKRRTFILVDKSGQPCWVHKIGISWKHRLLEADDNTCFKITIHFTRND